MLFVTPTLICFSGVLFQALVVFGAVAHPTGQLDLCGPGWAGGRRLPHHRYPFAREARFRRAPCGRLDRHNGLPVVANVSVICGGAGLSLQSPSPLRGRGGEYAPVGLRNLWRLGLDPLDGHKSAQGIAGVGTVVRVTARVYPHRWAATFRFQSARRSIKMKVDMTCSARRHNQG